MKSLRSILPLVLGAALSAWAWHGAPPPPPDYRDCPADCEDDEDDDEMEGSFESPPSKPDVCGVGGEPKPNPEPAKKGGPECKTPAGERRPTPEPPQDAIPRDVWGPATPPVSSPGVTLREEGRPPVAQQTPLLYYMLDVLSDDQVVFGDLRTGAFVASINLATGLPFQLTSPQAFAVSSNYQSMVVTNLGSGFQGVTNPPHLTFIDVPARRMLGRLNLPAGVRPGDVVISPDGALAYVSVSTLPDGSSTPTNPRILIVDIAARSLRGEIALPNIPGDLAVTPDGALLFAFGQPVTPPILPTIHVIDAATRTLIRTITSDFASVAFSRGRFAISPDGTRLYVGPTTYSFSPARIDGVGILDVQTLDWAANIPLGVRVQNYGDSRNDLEVSADGDFVYLSDSAATSNKVFVIDTRVPELEQTHDMEPTRLGPLFLLYPPPDL